MKKILKKIVLSYTIFRYLDTDHIVIFAINLCHKRHQTLADQDSYPSGRLPCVDSLMAGR